MVFAVECTLEHNDYINEVGQRRRFNDELLMMIICIVKVYYLLLTYLAWKKNVLILVTVPAAGDHMVSELQILADGYSYGECAILF
jgi:hypothetical protein